MLGLEPKAIRITWSVLLTIGLFALIYASRQAILIFLLAIFFAYMLSPAIAIVDRLHPRRVPRTVTLAIVYMGMITILIWIIAAVTGRASREAANLMTKLPDLAKRAADINQFYLPALLEPYREQIVAFLQDQLQGGADKILPFVRTALTQLVGALTSVGLAVLVPILSFFFLKDAELIRNAVLSFLPDHDREHFWEGLIDDIHIMLGKYIRALFVISAVTFVVFEVFFAIAGIPYGSLLATLSAVLEFVPVLGWITSLILSIAVAVSSGYDHLLVLIVFMLIYRIFQDYVLQPHLMSSGVAMHPLLVIFGVLAGEEIAGVPGMLFSIPVLAMLRLVWVRATRPRL